MDRSNSSGVAMGLDEFGNSVDDLGPLGIQDNSSDGWDWHYYYRRGATLDERQTEFLAVCDKLACTLREMPRSASADGIMLRLKRTFGAVLVQRFSGDISRQVAAVIELEAEFFRTVVTPLHQQRILYPVKMTFIALCFFSICAIMLEILNVKAEIITSETVRPFVYVLIGCLAGRLLYYGTEFAEAVTSLPQYFERAREARYPGVTIFFDLIIGFTACLFFITGVIIIAFGGEQNASNDTVDAAITSLMIKDNALLAIVFGLLVGVAKAEFLAKVVGTAKRGLS